MKRFITIFALVAGFVLLACRVESQGQYQRPAAMVNGEPIPMAELDAVLKSTQPPSPTPLPEAKKKEMREAALNLLVEDMLMRQYLKKNAQQPSPQEVEQELRELVKALEQNKQTLNGFLQESGQTEHQLRADIAARVQWKNFISGKLSDAAVKSYYETNKPFFDKVMVRASHILLKVAPNSTQNDRQIVYDRLKAIRQEVMTGRIQFQDAAKKYSDCPSKDNGGDIGAFPFKFAVAEPFARAAFSTRVGDVTEVVPTEFGYHIIKVTDRTPGEPSSFEKIKVEVKEILAQEYYQQIIAEQRSKARIETNQ